MQTPENESKFTDVYQGIKDSILMNQRQSWKAAEINQSFENDLKIMEK